MLPLISLAIEPKTNADQDRLRVGLEKLMAEDPTIRVQVGQQTGQVIIGCSGELHLEIIVDRLKREFEVEAAVGKPQVAYKETITNEADGDGRFVRQTGGRGQYGHAQIRVYPGARGAGYAFQNAAAGLIPQEYIAPIVEGIQEALGRGILAGYPIDDVTVELYNGSYHETDSSPMAFKIAGAMALQNAVRKATPILLEPIMRVEVNVPIEFLTEVIADLALRRARFQTRDDRGDNDVVRALVPLAQMFGYETDLRSRTMGRATYSMQFERYEPHHSDLDDDDDTSSVSAPRRPTPPMRDGTIALPEPDDDER